MSSMQATRRRDRRARGLRGPLAPPVFPLQRSRAENFERAVVDSVAYLSRAWSAELANIDVAVETVPPSDPAPWETSVALSRSFPADGETNARIVLYRQPIERRAGDPREIAYLIHQVIVEQLSGLLNRSPTDIDPNWMD